MLQIAVISKGILDIPNIRDFTTLDEIKNLITPYIKLIQLEDLEQNLIDIFVKEINLTSKEVGLTTMSVETLTHIYQLVHKNFDKKTEENFNLISTLLNLGKQEVMGDSILVKIDVNCHPYKNCSINDIDEIVNLVKSRYIFNAINITDKDINEIDIRYQYLTDDKLTYNNTEYKYKEDIHILNYNLCMYYNKDTAKPINKTATRLNASNIIYGDVIIISFTTETEIISLYKNTFMRLNDLTYNKLSNRAMTNEDYQYFEDNKLLICRTTALNYKLNNYKIKCAYCSGTKNLLMCSGCYRNMYDTKQCQIDDYSKHKEQCLQKVVK